MDRWAVICDVHGNAWALEAVVEDALARGATRLLNLGDVARDGDLFLCHGTPDARYAIVERRDGRWAADLHAVRYDSERAATAAERHGRPDWATWLRTGRARS